MLCVAFCVALLLVLRAAAQQRETIPISPLLGVWVFLGAMQGARIWHVVQRSGWSAWRDMFNPWEGGLAFHGGLAGGLLTGLAYALCVGVPFLALCDLVFPYLALGEAITRIGCFLNGCCWGKISNMPWAIVFPSGSHPFHAQVNAGVISQDAGASLPVHPAQIYMAMALIVIFFGLRFACHRSRFMGFTTALFLGAHGMARFGVEFFRGDSLPSTGGLTGPQITSALMMILAVGLFAGFRHYAAGKRPLSLGVDPRKLLLRKSRYVVTNPITTKEDGP